MDSHAASDTDVTANDCDDNESESDCAYYQWYLDRLSAWKDYLEEFNNQMMI